MSIFDIFNNNAATQAAQDQIAGLQQGYKVASGAINTGSQDLTTNYMQALQPFLQNYNQATQGTNAYANALGLNGGAASAGSAAAAYASNPAYQFQLQQGDQNVLRNAAATGTTASGATLNALQQQGQGLANTTYQQYLSNLQPFLGQSSTAASGIGGTYTGLGSGLNANQNSLANLGWQEQTGIGNANANAALGQDAASANIFGSLGNVLGGIASLGTGGGATLGGTLLAGVLSDFRLKDDIEPVGELYDGTNVYRYRYKWDDPGMTRIGVMAQEVERKRPDAIGESGGFKTVDYGKATDYAAGLARFMREEAQDTPTNDGGYVDPFRRFLDAA
jgi:Chaperone of endosialidase